LQGHPRFSAIMTDAYIELVTRSAPLHDIGKVGIPDHVLLKPGSLDDNEWNIMKTHAELGARAIEQAEQDVEAPIAFLQLAKEIAHSHHERWDGSGYPDGLVGENIPVAARLMAIADVFDALTSQRIYKAAMPNDKAREIILAGRGRQFDPDMCDVFLSIFDEFVQIAQQHKDAE
jgi:putative two-component system response regulator